MKTIKAGDLTCYIEQGSADGKICYILSFEPADEGWLQQTAYACGCTIVVICGMDWDNDLTPWPAQGEPAGCAPFQGHAPQFLDKLVFSVIPTVEDSLGISVRPERTLIGVSLSGLFTLWAWMSGDEFDNIASLSGSFWYDGFSEWMSQLAIPQKSGKAYFSLGLKEPRTPVKAFRPVGERTQEIVDLLRSAGITVEFQWNPGTHYAPIYPRLNKAFDYLFLKKLNLK